MRGAERAAAVAAMIGEDEAVARVTSHEALASEIPLTLSGESLGLVVNLFVPSETVSMSILWELTVPLIRRLDAAGRLQGFSVVEIRVEASREKECSERIVSVSAKVDRIKELPWVPDLLFRGEECRDEFSCYWYWDRGRILG